MRFGLICIIAGLVSLLQASKIENEKEEEYDAYIKKKLIPPSARKKNMKIGGTVVLLVGILMIFFDKHCNLRNKMKTLIICLMLFEFTSNSFSANTGIPGQADSLKSVFSDSLFNEKLELVKHYLHRDYDPIWEMESIIKEVQNGILYLREVTGIQADTSRYFLADHKYGLLKDCVWKWEDWYEQKTKGKQK